MSVRAAALLLTIVTGFSGLVYEVAWEKVLATLLGSHSEATAAVLALFLGGLALGYALFGAATRRRVARAADAGQPARLLTMYGFLEASIGVWALLFPFSFKGIQALSLLLPAAGGLGFAFDVALSALLVLPPAILMGGTIPILTQALARDLGDATRVHAWIYGWNTAGAFAGAFSAGFWILPALGLEGAIRAMGLINLAAGAAFWLLGRRHAGRADAAAATLGAVSSTDLRACFAVALLVGFAMMTVQTVLIRVGAFAFGASQFTFSTVVAVFVLCIALGSLGVSAWKRIPPRLLGANLWTLFALLALLYPVLDDAPYWGHLLRVQFGTDPADFYPFHLSVFAALLAVMAIPIALSGAVLPLLFDHLRNRLGELGDVAGRLYSWNTCGSLLGALFGGYALLFWLDLHQVFRLALGALVVAAALITHSGSRSPGHVAAGAAVAALVALVLLPAWAPEKLASGLSHYREPTPLTHAGKAALFAHMANNPILFYEDGPNASIAVQEQHVRGEKLLVILANGTSDATYPSGELTNVMLALVPTLLADRAERAFVVGFGTGVTTGVLASIDSMQSVTVAEIAGGVVDAAPLFAHANGAAHESPRVRIHRSDAYRTLLGSEERYDVIVSQPSNPWVTGVEMLYSREFLTAARDRLTPGGVHAQWIQTSEIDMETVALALGTYASVFDHAAVWYGHGHDIILVGVTHPETALDIDRLSERVRRRDVSTALRRVRIHGAPALLAHELLPLGVINALAPPAQLHTLLHPILGYRAARANFSGEFTRVPPTADRPTARVGQRHSLLRRYVEARGGRLSARSRAQWVDETCTYLPRECVTLLAHWKSEEPESPARLRIESAIRTNPSLSENVDLSLIDPLARLYDGGRPGGGAGLAEAERATELFADYYHHGAPFSRRALAAAWNACATDPATGARCRAARAAAEARLGRLDRELDSGAGA